MTNRTAANRYARALLDVAIKEHGDLQQIADQLAEFAALFEQSSGAAYGAAEPGGAGAAQARGDGRADRPRAHVADV